MATTPAEQETLVDKAWAAQAKIETRVGNFGKGKYGRVLKMARKPSPEEFNRMAKITSAGLTVLGALGFVIYLLMSLIPQNQ